MIVLDTNVISEAMLPFPNQKVIAWLDRLPATTTAITAITAMELYQGARRLPDGKRKARLISLVELSVKETYRNRVEYFDLPAAEHAAEIKTDLARRGRCMSDFDVMIAGICRARGASLATGNIKDFEDTGVDLINPWE